MDWLFFKCALPTYKVHLQFSLHVTEPMEGSHYNITHESAKKTIQYWVLYGPQPVLANGFLMGLIRFIDIGHIQATHEASIV